MCDSGDPVNKSDPTGQHSIWVTRAVAATAMGIKWAATPYFCAQMAPFCLGWRMLVGGIVGAAKAVFFGFIDHLRTSKIIAKAVVAFFEGAATALLFNRLGGVGKRILAKLGPRRVITMTVTLIVTYIASSGGADRVR